MVYAILSHMSRRTQELPTHFHFVKLKAFLISQIFKLKLHVRLYVVDWLLRKQFYRTLLSASIRMCNNVEREYNKDHFHSSDSRVT